MAYLPLLVLALITGVILASGLGILLSSVNVYLRDTQHLIEVVLTAWFWACPIVYPYWTIEKKLGPHGLTWVYFLNPVTPLVLTFQRCLYAHPSSSKRRRHSDPPDAGLPLVHRPGPRRAVPLRLPLPRRPRRLWPPRGQFRRGALIG